MSNLYLAPTMSRREAPPPLPWPGRDGKLLMALSFCLLAYALTKEDPRAYWHAVPPTTMTLGYLAWTRWMRR